MILFFTIISFLRSPFIHAIEVGAGPYSNITVPALSLDWWKRDKKGKQIE
jgi:hypothetical protein